MEIRNTTLADIEAVMEIYDSARLFMRQNGNFNQWINGYPSIELITKDINDKTSYVCIDEHQIIAVFCFIQGIDPTYLKIYEGGWINDEPYGVVHRIASSSHKKGIASYCLDWCFQKCNNIRIDTHEDNFIMQNLLIKNDYKKCGIIYLEDGAPRVAFQKISRKN